MKKNFLAISFGLALILICLLSIEGGLRLISEKDGIVEPNALWDKKLKVVTFQHKYKNFPDFTWTATLDENNFRQFPENSIKKNQDFYVFAGCSFSQGTGVSDIENFPYLISNETQNSHAFNFSVIGGGPHTLLHNIQEGIVPNKIKGKKGVFIYTHIDDQLLRSAGKYSNAGSPDGARFDFVDGKLKNVGNSEDEWSSYLVDIITESYLFDALNINLTENIEPIDIKRNCEILKKIKEHLIKKNIKKYYFVTYPGNPLSQEVGTCLDGEYTHINLNKYFGEKPDEYLIPGDGHPTVEAHKQIAKVLRKALLQN